MRTGRAQPSRLWPMAVALLSSAPALAGDLYVDPVLGPYTTIQSAFNAAASGDVVHVAPGTYTESFLLAKDNVTVTGAGMGCTTWLAGGAAQTATIQSDVTIARMSIGPGTVTGLLVQGGSALVTLRNVEISGGVSSSQGAALRVLDAGTEVAIYDSDLHDNSVSGTNGGGALYIKNSSVTLYGTDLSNNAANKGGAVRIDTAGTLRVRQSTFEGNTAQYGGAIYCKNATCTIDIQDSTFRTNVADDTVSTSASGGAIYTEHSSGWVDLDILRSLFDTNTAEKAGGAVRLIGVASYDVLIRDSEFKSNRALGDSGGALQFQSTTRTLDIEGSRFYANTSGTAGGGGALRVDEGHLVLADSIFDANTSAKDGGALSLAPTSTNTWDATIDSVDFRNNTATDYGGAIVAKQLRTLTIRDSRIWDNRATNQSGGGMRVEDATNVAIARSDFCDNIAATTGGGAYLWDDASTTTVDVQNNVFRWNDADQGGGLFVVEGDNHTVANNTFYANTATADQGNGLKVSGNGPFGSSVVTNNAFVLPTADAALSATGNADTSYSFTYNKFWGTFLQVGGDLVWPLAGTGNDNLDGSPVSGGTTNDCSTGDFRISGSSPLVDAGDPGASWNDGAGGLGTSRNDVGAFGGPGGSSTSDTDEDGTTSPADCNDANPLVKPYAWDATGDATDADCAGLAADYDLDADGYTVIGAPTGTANDCDDNDSARYPGASEVAWDGIVQNCSTTPLTEAEMDADRDGYIDAVDWCGTDCNDAAFSVHPFATEVVADGIDQDCNSGEICYFDDDEDDWLPAGRPTLASPTDLSCTDDVNEGPATHAAGSDDCNDTVATIYPGAVEVVADGIDQDCSGGDLCYFDDDDDDWLPAGRPTIVSPDLSCTDDPDEATSLHYSDPDDCNDTVASIHPTASEVIGDEVDQDCNGGETCYADADEDSYAKDDSSTVASPNVACATADGEATAAIPRTDCNDAVAAIHPGATEIVGDEVDQDCNSGGEICYADADEDTYADDGLDTVVSPNVTCDTVDGEADASALKTDCDDGNAAIRPGVAEVAGDEIDQNCDLDELCYLDDDEDDWLPASRSTLLSDNNLSCTNEANEATNLHFSDASDCNDTIATIYPGAPEVTANQVDENCDGGELCYFDDDGDDWLPAGRPTIPSPTDASCSDDPDEATSLHYTDSDDCNDTVATVYPGAAEVVADGVDQDCNGGEICYFDDDEDDWLPAGRPTKASPTDLSCTDDADEATSLHYSDPDDCNDANASIHPTASEVVGDEVDQDCNGGEVCYADADEDSYAKDDSSTVASTNVVCATSDGEATSAVPRTDCNDAVAAIHPGATEIVGDEVDQDCNSGGEICYADADEDTYADDGLGTVVSPNVTCDTADGEADDDALQTDCDDANAAIRPGVAEIAGDEIDQNCDLDELCYFDDDEDDWLAASRTTQLSDNNLSCTNEPNEATNLHFSDASDCNDTVATIYPGATESVGDEVDQNCDGGEVCYFDDDGDDWLPAGRPTTPSPSDASCSDDPDEATSLHYADADDCNDTVATTYPGATEVVGDEVDQDCNSGEICYFDDDGDDWLPVGRPPIASPTDTSCTDDPDEATSLHYADPDDCNDTNASIHPTAVETVADGIDQNCDGGDLCYFDDDGDDWLPAGRPTIASPDLSCTDDDNEGTSLHFAGSDDCNDTVDTIYPGAPEVIGDEVDQDCNAGGEICYADADEDGYADVGGATVTSPDVLCETTDGEADDDAPRTDCNDAVAAIHPTATEGIGDEVDQNCDGDEECYKDADKDDHADEAGTTVTSIANLQCKKAQGEADATDPRDDCDDTVATIHPLASESCNGIDDNCNDLVDDNVTTSDWFPDEDDDGYGDDAGVVNDCKAPSVGKWVATGGDCNDDDAEVNPDADEIPGDELDQDCDGDEDCYADLDEDGYADETDATLVSVGNVSCSDEPGEADDAVARTDCDDDDDLVKPGVAELPGDLVDQNCDGDELCFHDVDADGHVPTSGDTYDDPDDDDLTCDGPEEADDTAPQDDCNDDDADVHPGADEVVGNSVDDDCADGEICFADADQDGFGDAELATVPSVDPDCADPGEADLMNTDDCDDDDDDVNPDADEIPGDEFDQNCDGDELCYRDEDLDGWASDAEDTVLSVGNLECDEGIEVADDVPREDCDDLVFGVNPDADEIVNSDVDEDCDGAELCYADLDEDDFADEIGATVASTEDLDCDDPTEAASSVPQTDCNDADPLMNPAVSEIPGDEVDQNCNGKERCYKDDDGDGHAEETEDWVQSNDVSCQEAGEATDEAPRDDCDDDVATTYTGAPETPGNEVDEDCDGGEICFADGDQDGFADEAVVQVESPEDASCLTEDGEAPSTALFTDCDDLNDWVNPNAEETWGDAIDADCDTDELCFADADDDGYVVDPPASVVSDDIDCYGVGEATDADLDGDCNDDEATVNPGEEEQYYDGIDQDCDGWSDWDQDHDTQDATGHDNGTDCDDTNDAIFLGADEVWYDDVDQSCDGWSDWDQDGDTYTPEGAPDGAGNDCDDLHAEAHPGADEDWYNGVDEDCDGLSDYDQDGDGFDREEDGGPDCDDFDDAINPDATEEWYDAVDQDCDGASDYDQDGDGHDAAAYGGDDCNDDDPAIRPGVAEKWYDGIDQDCDGESDYDQDGDGFDAEEHSGVDCDDTTAAINPDALEKYYDGIDQNCDDASDYDKDGDGYDTDLIDGGTDCNDAQAGIHPNAADLWYDGVDSNCDSASDYDKDGDGYDKDTIDGGTDCDDESLAVHPDATEVWYDGTDQNCDDESDYDRDRDGYDSDAYGGDDCDDKDGDINPNATEVWYDGTDQDCDGWSDYDQDRDGFPSANHGGTDCDDTKRSVNPDASEVWYDGTDGNCDGRNDWDQDGDGFTMTGAPEGTGDDCNDGDPLINPLADEGWYNGIDQDCDGLSDYDQDGDGFTHPDAPPGDGNGDDCLDTDPSVHPGADEDWYDGENQNCDEESDWDQDGDGFTHPDTPDDEPTRNGIDCNDEDASVYPGAVEVLDDGIDQNCADDDDEREWTFGGAWAGVGCTCDAGGSPHTAWLALAALAIVVRRRATGGPPARGSAARPC